MLQRILFLSAVLFLAVGPAGTFAEESTDAVPAVTAQTNTVRTDQNLQTGRLPRQAAQNAAQDARKAARTAAQNNREILKRQIEQERETAKTAAEAKREELRAASGVRRAELQKALEDKRSETRQSIETKREEIRSELAAKREGTKQAIEAKRVQMKTEADKRKAELVGRYFEKAADVLSVRVKKLTSSADAIEDKIAVFEERGANLEEAWTRLSEARARLDAAEAAIAKLDASALAAIAPETREAAVANLRALRQEAEEAVRRAHSALVDAIAKIRFGLSRIKEQRAATSTATVATSTAAR